MTRKLDPPAPDSATRSPRQRDQVDPPAEQEPSTAVDSVLQHAREMIAANERLDMARLSAELGVDRTTLFRWVGNRDQLLVEVIWSVAGTLWRECLAGAEGSGPNYIARVIGLWVARVHRSAEFRAVVARDPERAMRLLAASSGDLHARLVAAIETLLRQEQKAGCLPHPVALGELAELIARTTSSYVWIDLVTGDPPDATAAQVAVGLLLRPSTSAS